MKNSLKLKEQRAALVEELQATVDLATTEERDFNEEEETRQAEIHESVKELDNKIAKAEETEQILLRNVAGTAVSTSEAKEKEEVRGRFSISKAISDIVNTGQLSGLEAEIAQEGRSEMANFGKSVRGNLTIPSFIMEGRANEPYGDSSSPGNSVTLQGQGSHLIGKDINPLVEGLRPVPVIERMGATRIAAQGDVVLPVLPNQDATVTNEGATVNNIDGDFSSVTLSPKRFAMRMDLSRQLLLQSAANLDSVIQADMANAIANALDKDIIDDIYTQLIGASKFSSGSAASATSCAATDYQDLTTHEGGFLAQNPAGANLALLMDPTMAAALKGVSQSAGGQILNVGNEILGYPVFTSTNVATATVVAQTYFTSTITDANDTVATRPIFFLDPADIFYATFGNLDVTIDGFTEAHKGVVRLIADYYADGAIRRTGSGRVLHGLTVDTTPTTVE
jgi:HK97 family phage major capsid protein